MRFWRRKRREPEWRFMPNPRPGPWHGVWSYIRVDGTPWSTRKEL